MSFGVSQLSFVIEAGQLAPTSTSALVVRTGLAPAMTGWSENSPPENVGPSGDGPSGDGVEEPFDPFEWEPLDPFLAPSFGGGLVQVWPFFTCPQRRHKRGFDAGCGGGGIGGIASASVPFLTDCGASSDIFGNISEALVDGASFGAVSTVDAHAGAGGRASMGCAETMRKACDVSSMKTVARSRRRCSAH